jgi:hypothetical protein
VETHVSPLLSQEGSTKGKESLTVQCVLKDG